MFSAQNGIFLQIQRGVLSLFYAWFQKKGRGGKLRQPSSEENRTNNKKAEILWHDKDFGFCCFLMKLSVIGEQKKR